MIIDNKIVYKEKKNVGNIPIMINSKIGENDEIGGYFLNHGIEKVIRFMIVQKRNHPLAVNKKSYINKGNLFTEHSILLRCVSEDEVGHINSLHYCLNGNVILRFFYKKVEYLVPVLLILRILKNTTDEEIFKKTGRENLLKNEYPYSKEECISYICNKFKNVIDSDKNICIERILELICSHLTSRKDKFEFLCLSIRKLYGLLDGNQEDDIDSMMNQEVLTELQIFSSIFRDELIKNMIFMKKLKTVAQLRKFEFNLGSKFERFISTGNLNLNFCSDIMQESGMCTIAERINLFRFISHFRVVNRGSFFQKIKIISVRKLKPESYGFLCPVHTPDGTPCGLLTHLSLNATVSTEYLDFDLYSFGIIDEYSENYLPVLINGKVLGYTEDPEKFVEALRNYRNRMGFRFEIGYIPEDSVLYPGIFVFSHPGRFVRPVERNRNLEFIGPMEQVFLKINLESEYLKNGLKCNKENYNENPIKSNYFNKNQYSEINQNYLSLVASLIPYSKHNQSPRNMYQCQMAKQSISIPSLNFLSRRDTKMYVLNNGQTPIVHTKTHKEYKLDQIPTGANCIVAVLSYTTYDMEDAMVINKSSIEKGMFSAFIYKTIEIKGEISEMVSVGTFLNKGDILCYKDNEPVISDGGYVDKIGICDEKTLIVMRTRKDPIIGDKFCSRHGQKGICSAIWDQSDMPFTEDGICPDIIINPHAFPSRMTIGMMIESIMGKAGCLKGIKIESCENPGKIYDEFSDINSKEVYKFLESKGYDYHGNEIIYSGITGQKLKTDIFIGVVFYQRLRHIVDDKFQVRSTGPIQMQTRQPIGGRRKHGGIRFGEMERDALIAHGCSFILQDRLQNCSDLTTFKYCSICKSILFCVKSSCLCGNRKLKEVRMPYVFKYLCTELLAINVKVELELE